MTIKNLLLAVASLVEERRIIDHGSIRCLWSPSAARSIESVEDLGDYEVETGTIGDDALAEQLRELAEDPGGIDVDDLGRFLSDAFLGSSVEDYLDTQNEDELRALDALINRARELFA